MTASLDARPPATGRWRASERDQIVLVGCALTVLAELASLLDIVAAWSLGDIGVPLSVVPAAGVVALLGRRALGRARDVRTARVLWVAGPLLAAVALASFARIAGAASSIGIAVASANEEVVYRFAVPTVLTAFLCLARVDVRSARIVAFAVAAAWFVFLPGHQEQMSSLVFALPFVAFAALTALVVYRSGSLAAAALAHVTTNACTVLLLSGAVSAGTRGLVLFTTLTLVVAAYGRRRSVARRPPEPSTAPFDLVVPVDDGVVIDLRDGVPPTVTRPDGSVEVLGGAAPLEPPVPAPPPIGSVEAVG